MSGHPRATIAFLAACTAITLVTGMIGWTQIYGSDPQRDLGDAFYHTLIAFSGDDSYIAVAGEPQMNGWVRAARFTGILTTFSVIATMLNAVLAPRILRWRVSRLKGHAVVIGASPFALDMIGNARRVVVFDTPEALQRLQRPARAGRLLMVPDPMIEATATCCILGRPEEIIFGDPDTATNVERAQEWLRRTDLRGNRLKVRIEDNTVARNLQLLSDDLAYATQISRSETIARALVTSMAPTALAMLRGQERVHIMLIGMSSVNLAVAEEMALRCHHHALKPLRLTVVDRDIVAARVRIQAERPDLLNPDFGAGDFEIDFLEMNALECCSDEGVGQIISIEARMPLTALVVAAGENARNVAIAMRLRQLQVEKLCLKAPIFMRNDSQGSVAAAHCDNLTGGIISFGGRHLDSEDLKLEQIYADLAQGIHDRWRDSPDVEKTPENDWDEMPTVKRRPSYRAALSAVELFYAADFLPPVGQHLAGLRLEPTCGNATLGDDGLIDSLTRTEHDRWNAERRLEGYCCAPDRFRDDEKKRHPLILSYEALLAHDRNQLRKDEANVRAALRLGVQRHEAALESDCWRKSVRIGIIGPLRVDADDTCEAVRCLLHDINSKDRSLPTKALEILSPNAPGFDRVAAKHLAEAWKETTGRPCRLLLLNAASPAAMNKIALRHVGKDRDKKARSAIIRDFNAQAAALVALAKAGHQLRSLDMRGLGVSDAELINDDLAYEGILASVQNEILRRADWMIFDTASETAEWTIRAMRIWEKKFGKTALQVRTAVKI